MVIANVPKKVKKTALYSKIDILASDDGHYQACELSCVLYGAERKKMVF